MHQYIFLSYARQDSALASFVREEIESHGIRVWQDSSAIEGGTEWAREIALGVQAAAGVVVLLTEHACTRPFVQNEIVAAINHRRPIAVLSPIGIAPPPELQFILGTVQISQVNLSDAGAVQNFTRRALERMGLATGLANAAAHTNAELDRRGIWPPFLTWLASSPSQRSAILDELVRVQSARPAEGFANLNLALVHMAEGSHKIAAPYFELATRTLPDTVAAAYFAELNSLAGRTLRQLSLNEANALYQLCERGARSEKAQSHYALLMAALVLEYFAPFGLASSKPPISKIVEFALNLPVDRHEVARLLFCTNIRDRDFAGFLERVASDTS